MKKKRKKRRKQILIILSTIILIILTLFISPIGKKLLVHIAGNYIYNKLDVDNTSQDKNNIYKNSNKVNTTKANSYVIKNILLLGVEEFNGASNTDCIIVATLNTKNGSLKLTSLMRDLYVEIPGYNNNKLNSVYSKGNIDLLYQTIKNNFGIDLEGYLLVDFSALEYIVDELGGIEVTLTKDEADYLNAKNYISNRKNRNVKEGTQTMNGNQVMGYCRVRNVSTGVESNDFGRTQRQRNVLNSVLKKVKKLNIFQLTSFMDSVLSNTNITTDISQSDFNYYFEQTVNIINDIKISEYRVPEDNSFSNERVPINNKNIEVLIPTDWNLLRDNIRKFMYSD